MTSFQVNNMGLLTYGAIGLTSIILAVITIYDKEAEEPDATNGPSDSSEMMASMQSFLPGALSNPETPTEEEEATAPSMFGQEEEATAPSIFGQEEEEEATAPSIFGEEPEATAPSIFGQEEATAPSMVDEESTENKQNELFGGKRKTIRKNKKSQKKKSRRH